MAPGVERIDWAAPWLQPWQARGEPLAAALQAPGVPVHAALSAAPAPVRFVPQSDLPEGQAYEQFIWDTRCVPTRDNLHDFFNGLVWLEFPQAKRRINELQAQAIAQDGVGAVRGPLRDALTVFDENGALLQAPAALWQALRARDWQRLFIELRPLWAEARLLLFGHALLEKLVSPRKPMVAHVYQAPQAIKSIAALDGWRRPCSPSPGIPSLSHPYRCWGCQAGGRATKRRSFTQTPRCFARPGEQTCTWAKPWTGGVIPAMACVISPAVSLPLP